MTLAILVKRNSSSRRDAYEQNLDFMRKDYEHYVQVSRELGLTVIVNKDSYRTARGLAKLIVDQTKSSEHTVLKLAFFLKSRMSIVVGVRSVGLDLEGITVTFETIAPLMDLKCELQEKYESVLKELCKFFSELGIKVDLSKIVDVACRKITSRVIVTLALTERADLRLNFIAERSCEEQYKRLQSICESLESITNDVLDFTSRLETELSKRLGATYKVCSCTFTSGGEVKILIDKQIRGSWLKHLQEYLPESRDYIQKLLAYVCKYVNLDISLDNIILYKYSGRITVNVNDYTIDIASSSEEHWKIVKLGYEWFNKLEKYLKENKDILFKEDVEFIKRAVREALENL